MGFLNSVNDMLNKGTAAAGRAADSASLKTKRLDIDRRWHDAAARLGESIYPELKANPALAAGREEILNEMLAIEAERDANAAEQERVAKESEQAKAQAGRVCASCGATLTSGAKFCGNCGAPVPEAAPAEPAQPTYVQATYVQAEETAQATPVQGSDPNTQA